ncbi:serum response factor-binding protein 1 isoform X2 [Bufo bufo]|uniref:serum response factor-binding protein 1 isoform X2 n=1 Tax=Bufo bufo TaxID=8384 RepID=UPI001ABEA3E0|nr:serum response factor-binding protein 1 isoform X2 [Bufo bufo]
MTAAAPVLNLNNEVVKMRKDVKKVKALTLRKLIRHISKLKSKKGTEELTVKNQRRAQRLLEEIQYIKKLKPDDVTKTALRKEIDFDKVFNKANSTAETRAVARLATHPLLKRKISAINDAIKEFKEARMNQSEQESESEQPKPAKGVKKEAENKPKQDAIMAFKEARMNQSEQETEPEQPALPPKPAKSVKKEAKNKPKQGNAKPQRKTIERKLENIVDSPVLEAVDKETHLTASDHSNEEPISPPTPQALQAIPKVPAVKNLQSSSDKETGQNPEATQKLEKKIEQSIPDQKVASTNESDSSDLEDSDEEDKEYFDDSTEERFLKQTPGFEDSDGDSEDDFFIGKVRQTKKKKSSKNTDLVKKDKVPAGFVFVGGSGTDEKKANTGPKNAKLESVFYTTLTKHKSSYMKRESQLPPARNKKPVFPHTNTLSRKPQPVRASAVKQSKVQEQSLHPSWEASRKRKEQSQIAVFQGKRIVFDD